MEDNYLWDRSGEPDPAIQELEAILGTLRYQPRPLEIPHHIQPGRRRSFFPALAIAAALALFAVLLGLWFSFNRRQAPSLKASRDKQIDQQLVAPPPQDKPNNAPSQVLVQSPTPKLIQKHREAPRNLLAVYRNRPSRAVIRRPQLTPEELAEKEQVLVALRLVSAKLNLAQRKTQGLPQLNTIRNQHKIG
jgi:hypothetical protein